MTLALQMTQDLAIIFNDDEFAETINYRPKGDDAAADIPAIIDLAFDIDLGALVDTTIIVYIPSTGITGIVGVALPVAGDLALIRSKVCRLQEFTTEPDGAHECKFLVGEAE